MLNRQKVLVHLLQQAGRPVPKIDLVKWCFLLRNETPSQGGSAFYHFLPYHYGPFSFCLYREIDQLVCGGLVEPSGDPILAERAEMPTRPPQACPMP